MIASSPAPETPTKLRQISAAAELLFLAHGYGAVSMDQVARTANVSKATLYAYFPSKQALFAAIMQYREGDHPLGDGIFPTEVSDLRATLTIIGLRMLRFMLRERTLAIFRIVLAEAGRFPEMSQAFYHNGPCEMKERFSQWLDTLRAQKLIEADNTTVAAEHFSALVKSGVFMRCSLGIQPFPEEAEITATVTAAVDTWMKAFTPR